MELTRLIEALSRPEAYPYPVQSVEVVHTHISVVFLAGPYVYKIKKPVSPGFLDFSTLTRRCHFCAEEVRLNRRLAPDVYLGVVPVVETDRGVRLEADGEAIEWAVKMQHLPQQASLQELLKRGEGSADLLADLAGRIAAFHQQAEAKEPAAGMASNLRDVLSQVAPQVGVLVHPAVFERVKGRVEEALARLGPLIEQRAVSRTRDCHGDLRLDHTYYFPDQPPPNNWVVVDCIEFNERFRFIDPVADMAFLVMDLIFHGRRDLADVFTAAYFRASGDSEGSALVPLYTSYRAAVRGTVEGMLAGEEEAAPEERDSALRKARSHWQLAWSALEEPRHRPGLVLVSGLPGTGKSWLSRQLAEAAGFCLIRADVVRKELAGLSSDAPTPESLREQLYTPEANTRTHEECLRRAEALLFEGKRVVVDATFRQERYRQMFLQAAARWAVPGGMLLCQADPETVRQRLDARRGDASDADWSVHLQLAAGWEEVSPAAAAVTCPIRTEGGSGQVVGQALQALAELGLWG